MSFREEVEPVTWPPTWNIGCLDTPTKAVLLGLLGFTVETHMSVCPSKGHFHREIRLDAVLQPRGEDRRFLFRALGLALRYHGLGFHITWSRACIFQRETLGYLGSLSPEPGKGRGKLKAQCASRPGGEGLGTNPRPPW